MDLQPPNKQAIIKYLLATGGHTLNDVAKEANVCQPYIHQIITNKRACSEKVMNVFIKFGVSKRYLKGI